MMEANGDVRIGLARSKEFQSGLLGYMIVRVKLNAATLMLWHML